MEGNVLISRRYGHAAGLWEISLALVLALVVASVVWASAGKVAEASRAQRTRCDMSAILEAGRQYEALHGVWPVSWQELHTVIPQAQAQDVWGDTYVLGADAHLFWVETGSHNRIHLSTGRMHGQAGRLVYEKRNVYAP